MKHGTDKLKQDLGLKKVQEPRQVSSERGESGLSNGAKIKKICRAPWKIFTF